MDSLTLTVIYNALVTIAREMGLTMMLTAYSPIFNEALDQAGDMVERAAEGFRRENNGSHKRKKEFTDG